MIEPPSIARRAAITMRRGNKKTSSESATIISMDRYHFGNSPVAQQVAAADRGLVQAGAYVSWKDLTHPAMASGSAIIVLPSRTRSQVTASKSVVVVFDLGSQFSLKPSDFSSMG
jgi:hypothetical protein